MGTLLLERPLIVGHDFEHNSLGRSGGGLTSGRLDAHGGLTLDDLITSVWEGLAVRTTVACPVCEGPMTSDVHDSDDAFASACLNCGSQLS